MSVKPGTSDHAERLRSALVAIQKLNAKVAALEAARHEPIAVVGMACRFPRADGLDAYWRLLHDGVDAISEVPPSRWDADAYYDPDPSAPGKTYTRFGGFLDEVDTFDALFFGISPREAVGMDPQHRLLLEVAWTALEHAGLAPSRLAGTRTGVFVGITANEYSQIVKNASARYLDAYHLTGCSPNFVAGRVSYLLGLHGPSMAVDTACSSSLTAVHLACQSLRAGDCDVALAGGVNLILAPDVFITASKARMLAPDGRCKTFAASADGFGRGEGCGVIVLKRLSQAIADGDRILGVIRGSDINQDGATSGLTVPNRRAQEATIRRALANAGIEPNQVQYVEAHGTGTPLGDPIEVRALASVLGPGRPADRPFLLGSVKTNIGHLESAAGIAGLIKVLLALQHRVIPPHLHFDEPTPHVEWDRIPVRVPVEPTPWSDGEPRRVAGISSFGASGTNVHLVVEEAPPAADTPAEFERPIHILSLSAKSAAALREHAGNVQRHLAEAGAPVEDACYTANTGRSHFAHRIAVVGADAAQLADGLAKFVSGDVAPGVSVGEVRPGASPQVVFLFTGQGSQYAGMGRELYESSPVFRSALERCAAVLEGELEVPLLEVLYPEPGGRGEGLLERTEYTQPALFALEWSLAELWRSWGVEPALVLGHSVGEYVAACVAGVLEVEEALRLVALRGRLMGSLPRGGVMVAVFAPEGWVREVVERLGGGMVSIAAVNGPESVVVSGAGEAVERVVAECVGAGVGVQRLRVSHAFHSPLMDPVVGEFERVASGVRYGEARIGVVSNVTGEVVGSEVLGRASYWARQLREAVRYADGVKALWARGQRVFVEVGPGATLVGLGRKCVPEGEAEQGVWLPSLRSGRGDWETLLSSVAELYVRGVEVDWAGVDRPYRRRRVDLPTYPFQRQRYWVEPLTDGQRYASDRGGTGRGHPLIGTRVRSAVPDRIFTNELGAGWPHWAGDHRVRGEAVLPAAAYVEMILAAAGTGSERAAVVEELTIPAPLALPEDRARTVQVIVSRRRGTPDAVDVSVYSLEPGRGDGAERDAAEEADHWRLHATATVRAASTVDAQSAPTSSSIAELLGACPEELDIAENYQRVRARALDFGPAFRGLQQLRRGKMQALGRVRLPEAVSADTGYRLHPALLDACLQPMAVLLPGDDSTVFLPMRVDRIQVHGALPAEVWSHVRLRSNEGGDVAPAGGADTVTCDVTIYDDGGRLLIDITGVVLRRAASVVAKADEDDGVEYLYEAVWVESAAGEKSGAESPLVTEDGRPGTWLILADRGGVGARLAERLIARGERCVVAMPAGADAGFAGAVAIDPARPADFERLIAEAFASDAPPARGVIYLWALDDGEHADVTAALGPAVERTTGAALHLVQALVRAGVSPSLWLVTRGVHAVLGSEPLKPSHAPLWGLGKVIAQEHPEFRCTKIDLDPRGSAEEVNALWDVIEDARGEDQIALRGAARYVPRLSRLARSDRSSAMPVGDGRAYRLHPAESKLIQDLRYRPFERRVPGEGEVEVRVLATGLGFRDVLVAMGEYPDGPVPLGSEYAGVVVAVGPGVDRFAVGDVVLGISSGAFQSHVTVPVDHVARKPAGLTVAEAAGLPSAFLTTYHALYELAGLREGERVLIHAAAGGVGMAAVQLALRAGAEVFATAGSPEKREFLRRLGVAHVMDSRTLDFAEQVLEATGGRGVDVVLNSLAGEFIPRSLAALAEEGRFLEIGKRGIWTAEQVAEVKPRARYEVIDLGAYAQARPSAIRGMFERLLPWFEDATLRPLPTRVFDAVEAAGAFRYMAQAKHIGKIVVRQLHGAGGPPFDPDAAYLITGGGGGLGLEVGRWLVKRGAGCVVLTGRSAPSATVAGAIRELEDAGARVEFVRADITRPEDVDRLLEHVRATGRPLRGVIHAAAVLDDGLLLDQDWSRFERVLAPKMVGGWLLHERTRGMPLDFFVLFSSAVSLLGSGGQANYVAANTFLDALAHRRAAEGLPALSVGWGPWSEVGVAADPRIEARGLAPGLEPFSPEQGVRALGAAMRRAGSRAQVGVIRVDWPTYLAHAVIPAAGRAFFERVAGEPAGEAAGQTASAPQVDAERREQIRALLAAPPSRRPVLLQRYVLAEAARVLRLPAGYLLDPDQPLQELGLDSLMAIELRNLLAAGLELPRPLPTTLVLDYPTPRALTSFLERELFGAAAAADAAANGGGARKEPISSAERELSALSDAEAEALLLMELERGSGRSAGKETALGTE